MSGIPNQAGATNGIASVQNNAADPARCEAKVASNGKHPFNLKAGNHPAIGSCQLYASEAA